MDKCKKCVYILFLKTFILDAFKISREFIANVVEDPMKIYITCNRWYCGRIIGTFCEDKSTIVLHNFRECCSMPVCVTTGPLGYDNVGIIATNCIFELDDAFINDFVMSGSEGALSDILGLDDFGQDINMDDYIIEDNPFMGAEFNDDEDETMELVNAIINDIINDNSIFDEEFFNNIDLNDVSFGLPDDIERIWAPER